MDANKVDMTMDRRKFLGGAAALGALAMGSGMMAGCAPASSASGTGSGVQTTETLSETGEASWYCAEDFEGGYDWTDGDIAYEAEPIDESAIGETVECDLVVCGAGIAGLAAAASAIEQGLSVIVLEKGTTYAAHGSEIGAIGGRVLAEAGLAPDPVDVYNEAMEAAEYRCDGTVWQTYIDRSAEAIDWLEDEILKGSCGASSPSSAADRIANGVNWRATTVQWEAGFDAVVEAIMDYAIDGGADIRFETPAVQLVQDAGGSIAGVIGKDKAGTYVKVLGAKGTLLATGSYDYNVAMMEERVRPRDMRVYAHLNSSPTDTGDGHLMGEAVGAMQDEWPHAVMNDSSGSKSGGAYSAAVLSVLRVNNNGERYVNEDLTLNYLANAINYQPGAHGWCICDANISETARTLMGDAPFAPDDMVNGFITDSIECASVAELAQAIGCEESVIQATLARYNELCDKGVDEDFHKSGHNMLRVDTPPYYAFEEGSALLVSVCGLRVNNKSQVLGEGYEPIPNLYASGNVSGSMFYDTYPHHIAGVSTGRGLTFGYLLGRRLAGVEE
ncbi:MAG: FAD-dependent oxidoreductase [Adlercreutzia sp.]